MCCHTSQEPVFYCYARLSKISPELTKGSKVKRGQVVAYVESPCLSTGLHLHYAVLRKGRHIDLEKACFDRSTAELPKQEKPLFLVTVANTDGILYGDGAVECGVGGFLAPACMLGSGWCPVCVCVVTMCDVNVAVVLPQIRDCLMLVRVRACRLAPSAL
ncbi:MAG: M23 family metallopeptidase [Anaplasma sp.]